MANTKGTSRIPHSPASQLADFIAKFDPAIGKLVRSARAVLRKQFPTAIELVYDNYNALAIGFASTERPSDAIISLAVFPRGVSLYFIHGAKLRDPHDLLKGSGNKGRFVPLKSVSTLSEPPRAGTASGSGAAGKITIGDDRQRVYGYSVDLEESTAATPAGSWTREARRQVQ